MTLTREGHMEEKHKQKLLANLRRIEGQIQGVHKMLEDNRYCIDIHVQLAAIKAATNSVGLAIMEEHTRSCAKNAIREQADQGDGHIEELMQVVHALINNYAMKEVKNMTTITMNVKGMSCNHCVNAIESSLKGLNSVQNTKVDLKANTVTVTFDEAAISQNALKELIQEAGYEIV
jgi:copper ion binding protein